MQCYREPVNNGMNDSVTLGGGGSPVTAGGELVGGLDPGTYQADEHKGAGVSIYRRLSELPGSGCCC